MAPSTRPARTEKKRKPSKSNNVEFWSGKVLYPAIVVLFVLSGFFGMAILPRILEQTHAMVGKPAPALSLPVLAGTGDGAKGPIDLASLRGRVVVLDFWAPWCGPCRHEMPVLDKLARKLAQQGVMVVGVLVDEDRLGAREFLKQAGIAYPQLEDENGRAARAFAVKTLPSLVVIDRNGTVRSYRTGFASEEDVEEAIRRAM